MQLNDETRDLNLRISPQLSTNILPPDIEVKGGRRKKVLSIVVGILIIVLAVTTTLFLVFSTDIATEYSKLRTSILQNFFNQSNIINVQGKEVRQFNSTNLSYFSDTELGKLGILSLPENFQIQEVYKGIRFVRSPKKTFSDIQIRLLKEFVDKTPDKLLNPGPTAIVTYQKDEIKQGTNFNPNTAAFASGSYVFFNDESFNPTLPLADSSVDAAFSTFLHELTHVAQFNEVSKNLNATSIDDSYALGYSWIDLVLNSQLIADFAKNTNWTKTVKDGKVDYELSDKLSEKTTDYGRSRIYEDMAETVSSVVMTNIAQISLPRQSWATEYLKSNIEELKFGKFPFSDRYEQVNASNLQYDYSKDSEYKKNHEYTDKQIFVTQKVNSFEEIKNYISPELTARGWSGTFTRSADSNNILRYKGDFVGKDRDMYIEMYTYDQAKGFSIKPKGTIIVVINGYLKK